MIFDNIFGKKNSDNKKNSSDIKFKTVDYTTNSPQKTFLLGQIFGANAKPGDIYLLKGDLGAGKTMFSSGFANGMGINDVVNSPTYTIVNVYDNGEIPLYHFDLYRINDIDEAYEIGIEEMLFGNGVSIIEWPDIADEILPDTCVEILIERDNDHGEEFRKITAKIPETDSNKSQ